jgi:hypothetical protein
VSEITGTLHSPQLSEAGVPARLQFLGDLLRIEGAGTQDVMADTLEVSVIGFNDDTLQLAWQEGDGTHAVTIADAVSQRALVASAPASLARKLRGGRGDIRFHRGKWNVVIGALVTCVLLVAPVWWQSEAITEWIANRVSMETELRIGEHALTQIETETELTQEGLAAKTVAEIGSRLTVGSRYKYRWYVSNDKEVNALHCPAYHRRHAGLIARGTRTGRCSRTTSTRRASAYAAADDSRGGLAAVLAVAPGDVSAIRRSSFISSAPNSRQLEAQADVEGMKSWRAPAFCRRHGGHVPKIAERRARVGDDHPAYCRHTRRRRSRNSNDCRKRCLARAGR